MTETTQSAAATSPRIPTVREVMHGPVISVTTEDTLWAAMDKMVATQLHHVGVIDGDRALGLISDRDLAAVWTLDPLGLKQHTAGHALAATETTFVASDTDVITAGEQLLKHRRDALLVVDEDGTALGVLTDRDLLTVLLGLRRPLR
ncbi:CBS domain-containing protein [Embleya scabrispora]|uniref:CBS domain-containing protein n=1 Tax=Embleya scabrispora TaxID=159449 RepID=UPI00037AFAC1|nr:CBS domain-containing protein [Embleya scabrispora]MYS79171.1 CBS domain-containing protein [Streptomyces sp. SID5474]